MILFLDASALVKRYTGEHGCDIVERAMRDSQRLVIDRVGLLETKIAVARAAGGIAASRIDRDRGFFQVIEVTSELEREAAALAELHRLRTLDAIHLAAALQGRPHFLPLMACWDQRLRAASSEEGLALLPESIE